MAAGQQSWSLAKTSNPVVESRRMGCVSFAQLYFPGGVINKENFQRARMAAAQNWKPLTRSIVFRVERGAALPVRLRPLMEVLPCVG